MSTLPHDPTAPPTHPADQPVAVYRHIVKTPDTCGGKARIAGSRITVQHVYVWNVLEGRSVEQIVTDHPHLSRAAVHAALAYYWDHQDEIHRQREEEERLVREMRARTPPSRLQQKLQERDGPDDPLPS